MRALRDMNLPKFVFEDVPLFLGLIADLFPGLDCPRVRYPNFNDAVEAVLVDNKYVLLPHQVLIDSRLALSWPYIRIKATSFPEPFECHSVRVIVRASSTRYDFWSQRGSALVGWGGGRLNNRMYLAHSINLVRISGNIGILISLALWEAPCLTEKSFPCSPLIPFIIPIRARVLTVTFEWVQ